jgi:hypothetical protein
MISPRRATGMVTYNRRPRSLWSNLTSVLMQPVVFYRAFPASRQWLSVAAVILALYGFSSVNQPTLGDSAPPPVEVAPVFSESSGVPPGIEGGSGGFIPPTDVGIPTETAPAPNVSRTVMTALLAAGGVVLAWFIQALILSEVSLINGVRPNFGRNLQIAVWATVPLGLMLLIQQIYFAAGGEAGQMGLSLLLERWAGFTTLPAFSRAVLMTLATNFTLFWLWSLVLLYLGGRYVLNGRRAAVLLVVVVWVIISVLLPAFTSPTLTSEDLVIPEQLEDQQFGADRDMMQPDGSVMPGDSESISPVETREVDTSERPSSRSTDEAADSEQTIPEVNPTVSESSDAPASEAPVRSGVGG